MAEHKKLKMLVKLDDGQTYTLGGDGADNAVTLDTEQTITAVKTFDKLPQSSAKPANEHDLVNKVYVDALKPKLNTKVLLNVESESTSWAAFNSIKFSTTTDKVIEPVYLEDTVVSSAVEPIRFVFKLADSFTGNATPKNKDFFKDYQLKDGEYFGTVTPSHLLEARWSVHTDNKQANPFSNYLTYLKTGPNTVLPFLEYAFEGLTDELKQVAFTIGDIYNSNGYPPVKFQFVVNTGAKEFTSKVYTRDADGIGRGSSHTVEFSLKGLQYVTVETAQTISGKKTFTVLPQSTVEPKADADLITKGYADGHYQPLDTKPHKYDILVKMKHDGSSWVGFSDFSVRLRNGTRLDIKHIENQSATTATQPVKAVFKTVTDLKAPIEAPKQQAATFFDSYKLEAGEFTGTVSFYKAVGNFTPASNDINPWYVYVGSYNANQYDGIYAVSIDNLDKPLLGVNFKFGDAHNGYSYTCTQCGVVFTVDGSALEVAYDGDMSNSFETTIEYPINAQSMIGVVTVDTKQDITGEKTFSENIKVTAKPKADTDVATVGYVSGLLNAKAPYDVTLDFKVEDDANGNWVVYSNMEINLDNGKKLKCIHIDNTQPTAASAPVKAVFKAIPADEAINEYPTEQAPTFFGTYQLKDEEYLGTLTYGHILNSQLQDYSSYKAPFHTNQYGTTCTIEEATQLRITLSELPAAVSKVSLKFDGSYLPKTFKATMSGVGMDVTSNVLTNPSGNTPLELLFDIVKLTGLVTLDTAQTITGAKTFEVLPKSEATPKEDADLITKAYLDERCPVPKSELLLKGSAKNQSYYLEAWVDYKDLRLTLDSGEHLVPLYLEGEKPQEDRVPARVIYKISDTPYTKDSIQLKDKAFFDEYVLKEKEILGHVVWPHLLNANMSTNVAQYQAKPFDYMLAGSYPVSYDLKPLIKFTFENLKIGLSKVSILHESSSLETFQIEWTHDNHHFVSKLYKDSEEPFVYGQTLEINIDGALSNFVTLNTQQEVTALKTFKVLPQSEAVPADDKDLVNKKYVDEKVGTGGDNSALFVADSPYTTEITISAQANASGFEFNNLELMLENGKKLHCKAYSGLKHDTVRHGELPLILKEVDAGESIGSCASSYAFNVMYGALAENEYLGFINVASVINPTWTSLSGSSIDLPFEATNSYGFKDVLEFSPVFQIKIQGLKTKVTGVSLKFPKSGTTTKSMKITCITNGNLYESELKQEFNNSSAIKFALDYISPAGVISAQNDQPIYGVKEFSKAPLCHANRFTDTSLVTREYVDTKINNALTALLGESRSDIQILFEMQSQAAKSQFRISNLEVHLSGDKKLQCTKVTTKVPDSIPGPALCVFKVINASEPIKTEPDIVSNAYFDTYQLQENEFFGQLEGIAYLDKVYASSSNHNYTRWPFNSMMSFGTTKPDSNIYKAMRLTVFDCSYSVEKVSFGVDSFQPQKYRITVSGCGATFSTGLLDKGSDSGTREIPIDKTEAATTKALAALEARIKALEDAAPKP